MSSADPAVATGEDTRERILRVATALFYDRGYRGTSVKDIASTVGISGPALYWHFSSKQEICFTAVHDELRRFVVALEPCLDRPTPPEQLGEFVHTYVLLKLKQNEWLRTPGAVNAYRELRDALAPDQQRELDLLQRRALEIVRTILSEGAETGDFRFSDLTATAFAIVTLCEYVFAWASRGGRLSPEAIADLYRELALSMVGAS